MIRHFYWQGTSFAADGPVPLSTQFASVKFSETSFTVHPGQTQQLTAHFTAPSGVNASILPIFSGFIDIASVNETFHVSYVGLAASLKDAQVVDNSDVFFGVNLPALGASNGSFILGPANFTFVGDDFPTLVMRLDFGTPQLRVDLVEPDIKIKTTLNQRDLTPVVERSLFTFPNNAKDGSFAQVKTLGPLTEFDFIPRNSDVNVSIMLDVLKGLLNAYTGRIWVQRIWAHKLLCKWHHHPQWYLPVLAARIEGYWRPD